MTSERRIRAATSSIRGLCFAAQLVALLPEAAAAVTIEIGSVRAAPGERAEVVGVLHAMGAEVAGAQVEFSFPASAPVAFNAMGRPVCRSLCRDDYQPPGAVVSAGDPAGGAAKSCATGSAFAFLPIGCDRGVNCTGVRALELRLDPVEPLPDTAYLFVCTLAIAPDAALGAQPLHCTNAGAASPQGIEIPVTCSDGTLELLCSGDCNGNERVTVDELVAGFRIAQGEMDLDACPSGDADGNGVIAITDLVEARNTLLNGCRPVISPTP